MTFDDKLYCVWKVLAESSDLMGMSPVFAPQAQALRQAAEVVEELRRTEPIKLKPLNWEDRSETVSKVQTPVGEFIISNTNAWSVSRYSNADSVAVRPCKSMEHGKFLVEQWVRGLIIDMCEAA